MNKNLQTILKYKNDDILKRYEMDYPSNQLSGEEALRELIKFLWLTQKHEEDQAALPIDQQLDFICGIPEEIDDMWHTFILFTKDYMDFCAENFGKFLHHAPTAATERMLINKSETDFSKYLSYVRKNLDEETCSLWFKGLCA
ncbi:MAG: hypothetical protein H0U57_10450 [Tatlockia sp.]|nr:hypothetical protein [Tatlockia sp.]